MDIRLLLLTVPVAEECSPLARAAVDSPVLAVCVVPSFVFEVSSSAAKDPVEDSKMALCIVAVLPVAAELCTSAEDESLGETVLTNVLDLVASRGVKVGDAVGDSATVLKYSVATKEELIISSFSVSVLFSRIISECEVNPCE